MTARTPEQRMWDAVCPLLSGLDPVRVENAADFYTSMINSAREPGPILIEVCL